MGKLKKNKGITLIALVISIIVLLILAGVAINLSIGENGLFNQTKLAVEKYKDAQNKEEEQLQIAANFMEGDLSGLVRDGNVPLKSEKIADFNPIIRLRDGIGFDISSDAKEKNNTNIVGYAYTVNGKVRDFTKEDLVNISGLELEKDYTINVIAMDEDGKIKKSNDLIVNTENKTYLYNNGDERISLTGGWKDYSRHGSNATMTKNTNNLYAKNTSTAGIYNSNYYASWITKNKIDLTNYKKIIFNGEFKAPDSSRIGVILVDNDVTTGNAYEGSYEFFLQGDSKEQIIVEIPEENKNGSYYIMITAANSNGDSHSEFTLNSTYLEK